MVRDHHPRPPPPGRKPPHTINKSHITSCLGPKHTPYISYCFFFRQPMALLAPMVVPCSEATRTASPPWPSSSPSSSPPPPLRRRSSPTLILTQHPHSLTHSHSFSLSLSLSLSLTHTHTHTHIPAYKYNVVSQF
uniref:Uncharacterized protein n=1 Tax=Physcomitrium patens TaxID=3218 RepID=A0A2K1JH00_PHYPA|nr:hypothetical protein PHYPA_018237 [Physcomitrium patens]